MSEVTLIALLRRRSDMSREEFDAYWRDVHAPLVLSTDSGNHVLRYERRPAIGDSDYDGVTVQTFASYYDFIASMRAPDFDLVAADLPNFLDVDAIHWVVTGAPQVER